MALPNIVVLFADNLGYNDIGVFGSNITRTPNIDRMASEGMKLNNWNSAAALCSASRAALLTGKYPVRTGVYPGVFKPGAASGLLPDEVTIAEYLKEKDYATSIVGKWHLGHQEEYLPTNQGFDEWYGIPYHMSGGSIDDHLCGFDTNSTIWLPLFEGTKIVQQPVDLTDLAQRYAKKARQFIEKSVEASKSFFLYVPFSHVHQLCAPQQASCQWASNQFSSRKNPPNATFEDAVEEMDWIAGEILSQLESSNVVDETLVIFTSDNGPWLAEKSCSGSKGPFEGKWLQENVDLECTACPHDYIPSPTADRPRRCVLQGKEDLYQIDGIHCGEDVGLGSCWEANVRMPAIASWPGHIPAGSESMDLVSTLDVVPTILRLADIDSPQNLDGIDIGPILFNQKKKSRIGDVEKKTDDRVLFFWRDGFKNGPLPEPFGRFDVVAAKIGRIKAWFYTKSSHYNLDEEVFHDPPLLFDVISDEAEAFPLDPAGHRDTIEKLKNLVEEHKMTIDWERPLTIAQDPKFIPCVDHNNNCRSDHMAAGDGSTIGSFEMPLSTAWN